MSDDWSMPDALECPLEGTGWTLETTMARFSSLSGEQPELVEQTLKELKERGVEADDDHAARLIMLLRGRVVPLRIRSIVVPPPCSSASTVSSSPSDSDPVQTQIARLTWALLRFHAPFATTTLTRLDFLSLTDVLGCLGTHLASGISLERQIEALRGQPVVLVLGLVHVIQALTALCLTREEADAELQKLLPEACKDVSELLAKTPKEFKQRWRTVVGYNPELPEDHGGVDGGVISLSPFYVCDMLCTQTENEEEGGSKMTLVDCRTGGEKRREVETAQYVEDWASNPDTRYLRAAGGTLRKAIEVSNDADEFLLRMEVARGSLIVLFGTGTGTVAEILVGRGFQYVASVDEGYRALVESFTAEQALEHIELAPIKEDWSSGFRKTMQKIHMPTVSLPDQVLQKTTEFSENLNNIKWDKMEDAAMKALDTTQKNMTDALKKIEKQGAQASKRMTQSINTQFSAAGGEDSSSPREQKTSKVATQIGAAWRSSTNWVNKEVALMTGSKKSSTNDSAYSATEDRKLITTAEEMEQEPADDVFAIESEDEGEKNEGEEAASGSGTTSEAQAVDPRKTVAPPRAKGAAAFVESQKGDRFVREDIIRSPLVLKFFVKKIRKKRQSSKDANWLTKAIDLIPQGPAHRLAVLCVNQLLMFEEQGDDFVVKSNRRIQTIKRISFEKDKPDEIEFFYRDKEKTNIYQLEDRENFIKALQERLQALNIGMRQSA